jgi:predicted nucleotidyltransferase
MGTGTDRVAEALFGKTKRHILALFFGRPHQTFYLRQIERETRTGIGAVQRELKKLVDAGLLLRVESSDQILYSANRESPVYGELSSLLTKTAGIADVLRRVFRQHAKAGTIEVAFIYGSVASGQATAASDIDVFVVGDAMLAQLLKGVRRAEGELGREINPTVMDRYEFAANARAGKGLVSRLLQKPRIMIIGTDDELEKLAGKPLDRGA